MPGFHPSVAVLPLNYGRTATEGWKPGIRCSHVQLESPPPLRSAVPKCSLAKRSLAFSGAALNLSQLTDFITVPYYTTARCFVLN